MHKVDANKVENWQVGWMDDGLTQFSKLKCQKLGLSHKLQAVFRKLLISSAKLCLFYVNFTREI